MDESSFNQLWRLTQRAPGCPQLPQLSGRAKVSWSVDLIRGHPQDDRMTVDGRQEAVDGL